MCCYYIQVLEKILAERRLLLLCAFLQTVNFIQCDEQEYRLTRYLMSNYDPAVRPAFNASQPLRVAFDMALYQIIDVDEKNQILVTNGWLTQKWTDIHLKWNASDFGGISVIRLPAAHVWRPDIVLYNNADSLYSMAIMNTNVIVQATGDVLWPSAGIFKSTCGMDVEYFPFDVQTCNMKFASWAYDGSKLDLTRVKDYGDFTHYQPNGEFDLDEFSSQVNSERYSCCDENYPDITYVIKIRRRPMLHIFNLILPCVLINGISLLAFCVPSDSGEKVTLGINTLLSLSIFLVLVKDNLPPTQQTPLISLYYGITVCLVAFATAFSILTLNVHYKGNRGTEIPQSMRRFILGFLAKVVFVSCRWKSEKRKDEPPHMLDPFSDDSSSKDEKIAMDHIERYSFSPRLRHRKETDSGGSDVTSEEFERHFLRVLNKVYETIERQEARLVDQERKDNIRSEWQQVAVICDRFLIGLFLLINTFATFFILFPSP
ncbi:neuronal acetylcholine receptor subunit alpha-10-like [Stegodyphus dumicola]|uniref:neuronal acetylcholine receptor subunit alpha-10-like n=1 Tax=Stegodyphus dumicola TaxID=202533 RepID=UPI0015AFCACB|nr:neuronal acetylcholine receptor subunit alpha-10-like [Stegodyphus dumicola]